MTEPTIVCPKCSNEIRLTESLAAPLIAATRQQFERQLSEKDADIASREQGVRERERQVLEGRRALDSQVATQVEAQLKLERGRVVAEESRKAKLASSAEMEAKVRELAELQEVLKTRDEKLAQAQHAEAGLIRKQRELDDAKRELELNVERRVEQGLAEVRSKALRDAEDALKQKVLEKDETIQSMQRTIEELKHKAERGSQQLQGEVQELELEALLRTKFPFDSIEPVPKGEFGGDIVQSVKSPGGQTSGTILWETKRTRNWSDAWLTKLREDQRAAKAEICVLVSNVLPKGVETFNLVDGVWVAHPRCVLPVAGFRRAAVENRNGLSILDRSAIPPADRGDRRSFLLDAGGPRQGTQGDHETVGEARRTDRTRHGRHDWNVRRSPGNRRQVAAGDRRPRVPGPGTGSRP
jgi:hypothetical protein